MAERSTPNRRRIMREFMIQELSAVDSPAQQHAVSVLLKRDDRQEQDEMQVQKIQRDEPRSFSTFEDACTYLRTVQGMSPLAAMEAAADAHPSLIAKYNAEGESIAKAADAEAAAKRRKPRAVEDFELIVAGIAERDGVPKHVALERAREENPGKFKAYQEA